MRFKSTIAAAVLLAVSPPAPADTATDDAKVSALVERVSAESIRQRQDIHRHAELSKRGLRMSSRSTFAASGSK
ncbi:MAG: hypothetical protein ACREVI_12655 [Steroidobacteraceae bacterium]